MVLSNFEKAKILAKQKIERKRKDKSDDYHYNITRYIISQHLFNTEKYHTFKEVPLIESSLSRVYKHIKSGAPIMFISAFTSNNMVENNINTKKLANDIIKSGLSFVMFKGHWVVADFEKDENGEPIEDKPKKYSDSAETTFMVQGFDWYGAVVDFEEFFKLGIKWCDKYKQYSVLIGRNTDEGIDFKYYDSDGNICVDEEGKLVEFDKLEVDSNLVINDLVNEYNEAIEEYIKKHPENYQKDEEYRKLVNKKKGSTEERKSGINLLFKNSKEENAIRENMVIVKNKMPFGKNSIINMI